LKKVVSLQDFTMIEKEIWRKWSFLSYLQYPKFSKFIFDLKLQYYNFERVKNTLEMSEIYSKESRLIR
jgi:hypothetical protein